jgi:GntR family transcriptional regulator of arabinose operon
MAENGKAKYYTLMEEMKTDILSGKIRPGEKLPSENQLSVRYGLSRHTVRKALGILAGDGYIESFQGKGTFCADVLRQIHGTGNIAVVTTYISDYIFPRLIQGIDEVLSDNGYSIILKNTGNSRQKEARFLEELISKGIDGLIIEVHNDPEHALCDGAQSLKPERFGRLMQDLKIIAGAVGREL